MRLCLWSLCWIMSNRIFGRHTAATLQTFFFLSNTYLRFPLEFLDHGFYRHWIPEKCRITSRHLSFVLLMFFSAKRRAPQNQISLWCCNECKMTLTHLHKHWIPFLSCTSQTSVSCGWRWQEGFMLRRRATVQIHSACLLSSKTILAHTK